MSDPHDEDLRWLAGLGGRDDGEMAEARWLRAAYQRWALSEPAPHAHADEQQQAALLARARAAGLLARRRPPLALSLGRRSLGVGVLGLAGLAVLGWWLARPTRPLDDGAELLRSPAAVQLLRDADPRARRERIAALLQAEGVAVTRYERLGRQGLDATLPEAARLRLAAALRKEGLRLDGADGVLRVEIELPR